MKKFLLAAFAGLALFASESQAQYPYGYGYGGFNPRLYNNQFYQNPYTGAAVARSQVYNPYTGSFRNQFYSRPSYYAPGTTYSQSYSPFYGNRQFFWRGY